MQLELTVGVPQFLDPACALLDVDAMTWDRQSTERLPSSFSTVSRRPFVSSRACPTLRSPGLLALLMRNLQGLDGRGIFIFLDFDDRG